MDWAWAWLPVIIASSAVTYLASAAALIGAVPGRVPLWPATLTQAASSFVNRISPANIGGMALNARFLQKNGVSPSAGVAAVGVNALMGAVAHLLLQDSSERTRRWNTRCSAGHSTPASSKGTSTVIVLERARA